MLNELIVSQKQVWIRRNAFDAAATAAAQIPGDKQRSVPPSISLWMTFCHAAALAKEDTHAKLSGITRLADISPGGARVHEYSS
jgi:hypothetical protein